MFHRIVVGTLQLVGCDVIDIGLTTTPGCQLAVEHHHAAGAVMLSASHNPIEWNALKLIGSAGLFLEASQGAAMRGLLETGIRHRDVGSDRQCDERHRGRGAARRDRARDSLRGCGGDPSPPIQGRARLRARRRGDGDARAARGARAATWWRSTWSRTVAFPREPEPIPENLSRAGSAGEGERRGHRVGGGS